MSVILPCYNAEKYVAKAVRSILEQSFKNIELIIIDDCSSDTTISIIQSIKDSRIRFIQKEKNTGYTDSLNLGIQIARGTYIARMDADDISLPDRIAKQVAYMETHPECIICGSWIELIPERKIVEYPVYHDEILLTLFEKSAFAHPGMMMRKSILDVYNLRYNKQFEPAEDYELWTRMMMLGKMHNIPEVLLQYRTHEQQISNAKRELQRNNQLRARLALLQQLSAESLKMDLLSDNIVPSDNHALSELKERLRLLTGFIATNRIKKIYPTQQFESYVHSVKVYLCRSLTARIHSPSLKLWFQIALRFPPFFYWIGWRNSTSFSMRCFGSVLFKTKSVSVQCL